MSTSFVSTRPAPSISPMPPAVQMPRSAASLPPRAKQKLATMIEQAEQARDAARSAMLRQMAALEELNRATSLRNQLIEEIRSTGRRDDQQFQRLEAAVADARAVLQRRQQLAEKASAAAAPIGRLVEHLLSYINDHHTGVKAAAPVALKMAGSPAAQLHSIRLELQKLQARAAAVREASPTDAEVAAAIRAKVDALAACGKPLVGDGTRELHWPSVRVNTFADGHTAGMATIPDAMAVLAWLNPAAMAARLVEEALAERQAAGREPGLPRQERMAQLAAMAKEVLALERNEEAVLVAMAERGTALPRRPDADPRAVLEVEGPPPSAA
jgi:hypothetical protein